MALASLSNNQCAFPGCELPIVDVETGTVLGVFAHIHAQSPGRPRFDPLLTRAETHSSANLILVCSPHHKLIDDNEGTYTADVLRRMKADHEAEAESKSTSLLARLVNVLAPDVPEAWEDRPNAPIFRLGLASSRPKTGSWRFEVQVNHIAGGSVGSFKARYLHGESATELEKIPLRSEGTWRLPDYDFSPSGLPFEVQLSFWWGGAERIVRFCWRIEDDFQTANMTTLCE